MDLLGQKSMDHLIESDPDNIIVSARLSPFISELWEEHSPAPIRPNTQKRRPRYRRICEGLVTGPPERHTEPSLPRPPEHPSLTHADDEIEISAENESQELPGSLLKCVLVQIVSLR